jgi:cytochrome c oxidase assembly protein subunit 11
LPEIDARQVESDAAERARGVKKHLIRLLVIIVLMLAFPFASVPLYRVFCQWSGVNGKISLVAAGAPRVRDWQHQREVTVEFVADADPKLPWTLKPDNSQMKVHVGEINHINFYAENHSDLPVVARAVPSISPGEAAPHFKKTQCFCFSSIVLKGGEKTEMPVVFYLDKDFPVDVPTVTLAYKVFNLTGKVKIIDATPR